MKVPKASVQISISSVFPFRAMRGSGWLVSDASRDMVLIGTSADRFCPYLPHVKEWPADFPLAQSPESHGKPVHHKLLIDLSWKCGRGCSDTVS